MKEREKLMDENKILTWIVGMFFSCALGLALVGLQCNRETHEAQVECIKAGRTPLECAKAITP